MKRIQCVVCLYLISLLSACGGNSGKHNDIHSSSSIASSSVNPTSSQGASNNTSASSMSSATSNSFSSAISAPLLLSYGNHNMQFGELRLPLITDNETVPLVIIIHGGCWVSSYANYHIMDNFAKAVTSLGYATWNIEYRALGTGGDWPVIFQDINKAVDYSRSLAQHYPVNVNKVALVGHSAGGHLALWAASRKNIKSDSLVFTENPLVISGVISLAGIANVTGYNSCGGLANNVIGIPIAPSSSDLIQRLQETSPLQMLPVKTKTILISGSADGIVPPSMGTEYSAEAIARDDDSKHYILQGRGHFDLIDANKTDWALYQDSLRSIFKD